MTGDAVIERISTHVLDTGLGLPAQGIPVTLEQLNPDGAVTVVGQGVTDADGRVQALNPQPLPPGDYRLVFACGDYFRSAHGQVFYPQIAVSVSLPPGRAHFHIPVLAGTFSYSTYLGS